MGIIQIHENDVVTGRTGYGSVVESGLLHL